MFYHFCSSEFGLFSLIQIVFTWCSFGQICLYLILGKKKIKIGVRVHLFLCKGDMDHKCTRDWAYTEEDNQFQSLQPTIDASTWRPGELLLPRKFQKEHVWDPLLLSKRLKVGFGSTGKVQSTGKGLRAEDKFQTLGLKDLA